MVFGRVVEIVQFLVEFGRVVETGRRRSLEGTSRCGGSPPWGGTKRCVK